MKNSTRFTLAIYFLSLGCVLFSPMSALAQGSNAPSLSITAQRVPRISVYGLSGNDYQLQYTPSLSPTNWQVLTNFILGTSPYVVVDSNAPLAGIRLYRALLLETNAGVSYAPMTLNPAEIFRFTSQGPPTSMNDTLVMNSAATGMLVEQDNSPNSGISLVTVSYSRVGPFQAEMSVIYPPSSAFPTGQTNYYALVFTGTGSGFFQFSDGITTGAVGEFSRDQSFIGQHITGAQLTAEESYGLLATNYGSTNLTTLVINSATSGILIDTSPTGLGITPVSIAYQVLGPLSCQLQVIIPLSSPMSPITNLYYLVYGAANSGSYQSMISGMQPTLGPFTRDQSLVGQQIAPVQLAAGESYGLLSTNFYSTNLTTLVISSATSGMLISPGNPPSGSITPVSIAYQVLGPLSCQLQVVIPAGNGFVMPQTNWYYLVFATTNSGSYQSISGAAMQSVGLFTRDQSLVSQQIAPAQLTAGESYSLLLTNFGVTNLTTLVINSATDGMLISPGNPPPGSITPVSITYQLLGSLSSQLQVVIPASNGFPTPQTNWYYLVYSTANSGSYQSISGAAMQSVGLFTRDQSQVGQQLAPAQLTAGESYGLLSTNFNSTNLTTLAINSATSGMLIVDGMNGSITPVSIEYQRLGPLSSQLQVVIPAGDAMPTPQTNWYYLVYSTTNSGSYQSVVPGFQATLGPFTRDQSLVGQQIAPMQLTAGESYGLLATNSYSTNLTTLVINSATSGTLISPGNPPPGSITPVSIAYQLLGPLISQLQVVIPAGNGFPTPQTNWYYVVFTTTNSGSIFSGSGGSLGLFTRDQSLVGQQIAPMQLTAGESYGLLSTNSYSTNLTTLVINSATSGMLISPGNPPPGSITPVSIEYQRLGPLSSQLQVVIPASNGFPMPQTNWYYLVYSTANSGSYQSIVTGFQPTLGPFTRDQSLVGQQIAPAQLTAGENYSLVSSNAGITNLTTLVINSATDGMLISPGNPSQGSITPVGIAYQLLGPLSCQLQVVIPASNEFPTPQTNWYYLVFTTTNSGSYQSISGAAMQSVGTFTRDQSMVGQQIASVQLAAGENYSLVSSNAGITNLTTLVINSATSGILIDTAPAGYGITPVSITYQLLGALSSQLQVVIPASNGFPTPQTNWYYLIYTAANSGSYQSISGAAMQSVGTFTRDRSLVGQQIAPSQLTAGESYSLISSNGAINIAEALIINSPTNCILVSEGAGPDAGIFPNVALQYLALTSVSAQIQAVIPPTPPTTFDYSTNTYLLVYTASNSGQFLQTNGPAITLIGQFIRSPAQ